MRSIRLMTTLGLFLALGVATTGCAVLRPTPEIEFAEPASVGMSAEKLDTIKPALMPFADSGKTPGFVSLVAKNGKIVHHEAFGPRDVENQLPMEKDTIFRMFSMTKPVTAVAVMQQVERGTLAISDPVSKYIPEFAEMEVLKIGADGTHELVPAETTVTIEHLMTHTSGLSYGIFNPMIAPYYEKAGVDSSGDLTLEAFAKAAGNAPLLFEPGTQWEYSIAMDILGRIVEITSGMPFDAYLEKNVFQPLGMTDSAFWVPEAKRERFAALYNTTEDHQGMTRSESFRGDYSAPPNMPSGGGDMVGTVIDYYRFAQALLNGGELDGVRILSEAMADEIKGDHLGPELGDAPLKLGDFPLRGLGFGYCGSVVRPGAMAIFGKPGTYWWGGYASTDFWIDPSEDLVAILCTQLIPAATHPTRVVFSNAVYKAIEAGADAEAEPEMATAE